MIIDYNNDISEKHKLAIAKILQEAFWDKLKWYFKKVSKDKALILLEKAITYNMGFYYIENDNVLGAALLSKHDSKHLNIGKDIIKQIGFLRGLLLKVSYSALHKTKYELWLQMIAVSPSARGKGIGRNMMTHLYQVAKNENAKEIALDVIDSNPKAKKLYEKEGFCVTKYIKTKFFTRGMGFDGIFVMRKKCN